MALGTDQSSAGKRKWDDCTLQSAACSQARNAAPCLGISERHSCVNHELRQIRLTKRALYGAEYLIEFR